MQTRDATSLDNKYRLSAAELNQLLRRLAAAYNSEIKPDCSDEYLLVVHEVSQRKFYLSPMCRDSLSNVSNDLLPFFWDRVVQFVEEHKDRNCTLLVPLRMSRPFCKIPALFTPKSLLRQHAVLVEVNFAAQYIVVHDSQGNLPWFFYPDKIAETLQHYNTQLNMQLTYSSYCNYNTYNNQKESSFDCGYFVYHFVEHFFREGTAAGSENLKFSVADSYKDKKDFLVKKLGADFISLNGLETEDYQPAATKSLAYENCLVLDDYDPSQAIPAVLKPQAGVGDIGIFARKAENSSLSETDFVLLSDKRIN